MRILMFAAAFREGSYNKKFIRCAHKIVSAQYSQHRFNLMEFNEFHMPLYDGDLEKKSGIPDGGKKLIDEITAHDAIIISTPEYNAGIPGTLKNAIDWVSRANPVPLENKNLLLIAASPGSLGGVRSLWHSRQCFETLKTFVYPEMMGLQHAHQAFDESGDLKDGKTKEQLGMLLQKFMTHLQSQKLLS